MFNIKDIQWELRNSPAAKAYGLIIALAHIVLAINWLSPTTGFQKIFSSSELLCWPMFSPCTASDFLNLEQAHMALWVYLSLATLSILFFLSYRFCVTGIALLSAATALGAVLYLQDYRLHSPVVLALICLSIIYVTLPTKRYTTKNALVLFFITFGLAKLNLGWLENNGLYQSLQLPIPAAKSLSYVFAVLETVIPLFLLVRLRLFTMAITILAIYNLIGIFVFDFWLSIIKILFLGVFFAFNAEAKRIADNRLHFSYERPEPSRLWIPVSLLVFAIALFANLLARSGHTSPFSFFKRTAYKSCKTMAFVNQKNTFKQIQLEKSDDANCDPYVIEYSFNKVCSQIEGKDEHQFYLELTDLNNNIKKYYFKNYCDSKKIEI